MYRIKVAPVAGEKVAQVQVTEILRVQKNQGYSPSRSELRDWYLAVKTQGNGEDLGRIEAMGRQLNDAYCETIGQEKAAIGMPALVQTPMEFRSVLVTLDPADWARIRKGILQQSQLNGNQTTQRQEGNIFGR